MSNSTDDKPTNRLAGEKSPYLLQHKHNPVDWYPWGDEAFEKARSEDKPIFLSIGYSTCHWCHVMERESFENGSTAQLLNDGFVSIKVDREERPDVDGVYMAFVQATTGGGGWPMSVFLTPDLKPFFGGTYFPPEQGHGRPSFPALLNHIAHSWAEPEKRDQLKKSGDRLIGELRNIERIGGTPELLDKSVLVDAYKMFQSAFDEKYGGFGQSPKFPRPVVHDLLLRYFNRTGDEAAAEMVLGTLGQMARSGMHDHLAGGFHRYSVDRLWHVPHFEKMLYDQAQIAMSYLEAYQVWPQAQLADVARTTLDYVLRDLTDPATGGFYSAEDADSRVAHGSDEKKEGAFYVFTKAEIDEALGPTELLPRLFCHQFGIVAEGNADDPHGELLGKNVLHRVKTVASTAAEVGKTVDEVGEMLAVAQDKLLSVRARRPRPLRDDKILTCWNGMMIGALARGFAVLDDTRYVGAAVRAANFILNRLFEEKDNRLHRRYREGAVAIPGYLEDYVHFVAGLIELYQATFDLRWLRYAEQLTTQQIELFHDNEDGGFYTTSGQDPSVLLRSKDDYDGAEPAANSIAVMNLAKLGHLLDRRDWVAMANKTVRLYSARLKQVPHALPEMLCAFDLLLDGPVQVVIAGERSDERTEKLLRAVHRRFVPHKLLVLADEATRAELGPRLKALAGMQPVDGKPAAHVCRDWTCERPTTDAAELEKSLGGRTVAPPQ